MPRLQSSALPVLIEHSLIVAALAQRWAAVAAELQLCLLANRCFCDGRDAVKPAAEGFGLFAR